MFLSCSLIFCSVSCKLLKQNSEFSILDILVFTIGLPRWCSGYESSCQCRSYKRCGFNPWVKKIPGVGNGYPLQYSCLESIQGQRNLAGSRLKGCKESDMNEHAHNIEILLHSLSQFLFSSHYTFVLHSFLKHIYNSHLKVLIC